ncbi:ACT domain-containing protein ACR9 [Canna indica]|uniref:ACT domain-containing protein ACR n=1 Tax=Canna indica TaxID=4628 RepID=A0AAQ3KUA3_9LILI|nr:ACT domain-containing protein ACR9 [Canna indica]
MGMASDDDAVAIQVAKRAGEPSVITVNCTDEAGLGCEFCSTILEFGLCITRADLTTDGQWCYAVFWVVPCAASSGIHWMSLKNRLISICPSCTFPFYFDPVIQRSSSQVYLLSLFSNDRKGLLHDVTRVLCELGLLIHRVKVSTTPDGKVVDLFFVTDTMELLHTKKRQDETYERLSAVLQESLSSCEIVLAEGFQNGFSCLPPEVAEKLFSMELSDSEFCSQNLTPDMKRLKKAEVKIDNSLCSSSTLLQIHCVDQKGLLYDIMRMLNDFKIKIAYGRYMSHLKGSQEIDLFIQQTDGKKITDPDKLNILCSRLKSEMLRPLRVMIVNRGPDIELLVANPVELSGKGRPRVFYDSTLALKVLGICIFSAEIGRHSSSDRQWEVYRFLLVDSTEFPLASSHSRNQIVDRVRRTLMGW